MTQHVGDGGSLLWILLQHHLDPALERPARRADRGRVCVERGRVALTGSDDRLHRLTARVRREAVVQLQGCDSQRPDVRLRNDLSSG